MTTTETEINTAAEQLEDEPGSSLELLPPARPVMSSAIATLHEHHAAMGYAADLAAAMVDTEMVPTRYRGRAKKGDAAAAILYGAELGLNPIQSLQNIFAVHGTPSMYARTMKALLRRQGYKFKTIEESDTVYEVHGWEPGSSGEPDEVSRWTIEDAQKAEFCPVIDPETGDYKTFTKKNGETAVLGNMKYITQPKVMLYAKGTAEICRKLAPDVLLGIAYSAEELEAEREPVSVTSERAPRRRGGKGVDGLAARAEAAQSGEEPIDAETVEDSDPGQGGGNEQSQGAEPSSGPQLWADSADKEPAEPKTAMRKAVEKRLFGLIGEVDPPLSRDDRLDVYRGILGDPKIQSTNDLNDVQVSRVGDFLYQWGKDGELNDKIRDLLMAADAAATEGEPS
jgi:hypothetical protein